MQTFHGEASIFFTFAANRCRRWRWPLSTCCAPPMPTSLDPPTRGLTPLPDAVASSSTGGVELQAGRRPDRPTVPAVLKALQTTATRWSSPSMTLAIGAHSLSDAPPLSPRITKLARAREMGERFPSTTTCTAPGASDAHYGGVRPAARPAAPASRRQLLGGPVMLAGDAGVPDTHRPRRPRERPPSPGGRGRLLPLCYVPGGFWPMARNAQGRETPGAPGGI